MDTHLDTLTTSDGTRITLERAGDGPAVVLIGGAFNDRSTVAGLAATLANRFSTITYDRRGRGASNDASGFDAGSSRAREIDDLAAVIAHVGGRASVFGHSSGAVLALETAAARPEAGVERLVVYEPTFVPDGTRPRPAADLLDQIERLMHEGQRDDAVARFQVEAVGLPREMVEGMRAAPFWGFLVAQAGSLPYDIALFDPCMEVPVERLRSVRVPTLAIAGSQTFDWIKASTQAVADAVPDARYLELEGQDHGVLNQPEALRLVLEDEFLG